MRRLGDVVEAPPALVTTPAWAATTGAGAAAASLQQSGNSGFDANMVIILAALLCFLICALGLSSLIRCALRCARSLSPAAAATATPTPAGTAGLKKKELRRIPVEVYGPKAAVAVADAECAICLGEFAAGDKVRVLPRCHHGFHVRCIDTWLAAHSSCPTCRDSVISVEDGVAGDDATPTAGGQR